MKIKTADILAAVSALLPVTQKRITQPIMSHLRMEGFGGWLTIKVMNMDEYAERTVECEGDIAPFCINAERLMTLLRHETSPEITLAFNTETKWVKYQGGAVSNISTIDAETYPKFQEPKMVSVGLNCEDVADFVESVEWVTSMVSKERLMGSPWYGTINVTTEKDSMTAMATTGVLLARRTEKAICSPCSFDLMRAYATVFCEAMRSEESDLLLGESHIGVTFKGGRWIGRLLEEKFQAEAGRGMFKREFKPVGSILPGDILPHLEICNSFTSEAKSMEIRFDFEEKRVVIKFRSTDSQDYEYAIEGKFVVGTWNANSSQLLSAVRKLNSDLPFEIKSGDGCHYLTDGSIEVIMADVRMS
jgi:DNA polymerase III sliding clamp (beta) subunit (PCNA family)